jgi:hypothetical protein
MRADRQTAGQSVMTKLIVLTIYTKATNKAADTRVIITCIERFKRDLNMSESGSEMLKK